MSSDNSVSQWTQFMTEILDRLTGKGAIVEYNFENLTIDVPKILSPEGKQLSAKWTINGKVTIKAETHSNK
ncbi:MAG: hypothetical protein ACPKPY_03805 [Nitrososphaeraceae archaeon]